MKWFVVDPRSIFTVGAGVPVGFQQETAFQIATYPPITHTFIHLSHNRLLGGEIVLRYVCSVMIMYSIIGAHDDSVWESVYFFKDILELQRA